jgi:predicted nucleotidyltransferase
MDIQKASQHLQDRLPGLLAIYVFGSHASGDSHAESDLDLAVLLPGTADPLSIWRLSGELADIVGVPVDLVDLRSASTVMQYQIMTKGQRLWARSLEAGLFEAFVLSEKTALDTARAGLLQDIQQEGFIHDR